MIFRSGELLGRECDSYRTGRYRNSRCIRLLWWCFWGIRIVLEVVNPLLEKAKTGRKKIEKALYLSLIHIYPMKWPVKKLKNLSVQINSGNTPKGGSENYVEEGITFFRSQNVWKDCLEMDDIVYILSLIHI